MITRQSCPQRREGRLEQYNYRYQKLGAHGIGLARLRLGEQGFQRTISAGGFLEHGIAHASTFSLVSGGVQQSCIEVANLAVSLLHVVREVDVAAATQSGVFSRNQDKWPLSAAAVMCLGGIGEIHNHRVIQHRAVPFGNSFQFFHQVGNQLEVELANLDLQLIGIPVFETSPVTDACAFRYQSPVR